MKRVMMIAALVAGFGCASIKAKDNMDTLRRSVKGYNEAYRWKNFERAAAYLPEDVRMSFIATYEDDEKSLHVEDYQVLQVKVHDENTADVQVRVTYMMLPSVVVQRRRVTQHWHRVAGQWLLENEDNPIRDLNEESTPKNPDAFGGGEPEPGDSFAGERGSTSVQVTDPEGNVVRDDTTGDSSNPEGASKSQNLRTPPRR